IGTGYFDLLLDEPLLKNAVEIQLDVHVDDGTRSPAYSPGHMTPYLDSPGYLSSPARTPGTPYDSGAIFSPIRSPLDEGEMSPYTTSPLYSPGPVSPGYSPSSPAYSSSSPSY